VINRNIGRSLTKLVLACAAVLLLPLAASASPITYIYSGTGSGSLDGNPFSTAFTITAQADTDNVGGWCCSTYQNTHSSASVALVGLGTFSFLAPTHTWLAPGCCMGFGADLSLNYLTLFSPAIVNVGYALDTAFGPVTSSASTQGQFVNIGTSGGALTLSQVSDVTFQAETSAVPEPSTYALMALGLAGIVAIRRAHQG
jgi:hypothetical protein